MTRRLRGLFARIKDEDDGISLPLIASMMILLLGMSAFAVDLGWIYLNGGRLQRGADSAALAGVVYLPHNLPQLEGQAVSGANANGWNVGTVIPDGGAAQNVGSGPDTLAWNQMPDNRLQVELRSTVDTFFLKVLGFDQFSMSRRATAQFIKPVPLGAPANCIGIGEGVGSGGLTFHAQNPNGAFATCNEYEQNFWSAINGRATAIEHGDPYGPTCGWNCGGGNPNHDQYYYFAIDVPAGAGNWVDVFLYDAGFYDRSSFGETGDEDDLANSNNGGTNMSFELFAPDSSPQIPENNTTPVTCSNGSNSRTINSEDNTPAYMNTWRRMCRISGVTEGIYVLRVGNGGNSIGGSNSYSILADSQTFDSDDPTRVYSLNEMSIFTNDDDGNATVYIAEVEPIHANKILELTFYDPGETDGDGEMSVVPPPGVSGYTCSWTATNNHPPNAPTSGNTCSIETSDGGDSKYNAEWITMQIELPSDYTCSTDCFWKMNLDLVAAHDRTTWEARVIGNPVALVPNEP